MSKLLEYEVKGLLAELGVAVPRSALVGASGERGTIPADAGPYFVKAQIPIGDRAAVGAVVRMDDLESARAATGAILGRDFRSNRADSVLIECAAMGDWEGYAAVVVAEDPPRRVVVFSPDGGAGFDPATAPVQLDVTPSATVPELRASLEQAGVAADELDAVETFLGRLVDCAVTWSAYTLETNPVTVVDGEVMVLDAKADLDDYSKSLIPRPELLDRPDQDHRERAARECQQGDHRGSLRYVQLIPDAAGRSARQVASHSVGGGESMVVLDALAAAGLNATNYCDTSGSPSAAKVATGAGLVAGQPHIEGLLFSTCIANQALSVTAQGLLDGWDEVGWRGPTVARFAGNEAEQARAMILDWADRNDVPVIVLGEHQDEWQAAARLADLLDHGAAA